MSPGEGKFKFWSEHAANANSICHDFGNQLYGSHIMGCIFYGEQMVIPYAMILQLIGNGASAIKLNRVELDTLFAVRFALVL